MSKGLPGTFYQTKRKRRDFAAQTQAKYGSLGPAGPAVSLLTGEIIPKPKPKPSPSKKPPRRINHERQKAESERRFEELEKLYSRGESH